MENNKKNDQKAGYPVLLNKYLSSAGVSSRRLAAEYIKNGQVQVNGVVIKEPWHNVKGGDKVLWQGKTIHPDKKLYFLLNKPADCVTTLRDEAGRRTVVTLVHDATDKRIYPVGRLDRETTGLIVLTNDGALTQRLAHPSNAVKKVYHAVLDRELAVSDLQKIRKGLCWFTTYETQGGHQAN